MEAALGADLYDELEDDIEAIEDHSDAALEGKGLGARGIHDLVRHEPMRQYLDKERAHLKRWNARLDRITEDRVGLFTKVEYHRSAWYFDPKVPDQLMAALVTEQNCVRDMCRTEDSLKAVSEYFHKYPYYILPALMTVTTLFQTWLNPTPPDPVQAKMMWIMPLVFSVMFFFFPAGLVLYWITNNILSIAQQWMINTRMGVPPQFNLPKFK